MVRYYNYHKQLVNCSVIWRTGGVMRLLLPCVVTHTLDVKKMSLLKVIRSIRDVCQWCGKFSVSTNTTCFIRKSPRMILLNTLMSMWLNGDYFPQNYKEIYLYNGGAVCFLRMVVIEHHCLLLQPCSVGDTWKKGYAALVRTILTRETRSTWRKTCPSSTLCSTNPTWNEPEPLRWKDGVYCLSHGSAFFVTQRMNLKVLHCPFHATQIKPKQSTQMY
jgi:hypothetical protein